MADDVLTVLARFVAQDQASAQIAKVDKELQKVDRDADEASRSMNKLGREAGEAGGRLKKLSSDGREIKASFDTMTGAVTGAVTAFAAMEVVQEIKRFHELGDAVNDAAMRFTQLGGSWNTLLAGREATRGLVSDMELFNQASDLVSTGIVQTTSDATAFMGVAGDLALFVGGDMTTAIQDFTEAMNTGRVTGLAKYGIDLQRVRQLAEEFGGGMEGMRRAILTVAGDMRDKNLPAIEDMVDNSAVIETKWQNIQQIIGIGVNNAVENVAGNVLDLAENMSGIADEPWFRTLMSFTPMGGSYNAVVGQVTQAQREFELANTLDTMASIPAQAQAQGQEQSSALELMRIQNEIANIGARNIQVAQTEVTAREAEVEAIRASEEIFRQLSGTITSEIEKMLGWTPPEQRAQEAAQGSVVDALNRAGLSQSEQDAVMQQAQALLPALLAQGMAPDEATMRAYGIYDATPGEGRDARYIGQDVGGLPLAGALPTFGVPRGLYGGFGQGGSPIGAGNIWDDMAFQYQQGLVDAQGQPFAPGGHGGRAGYMQEAFNATEFGQQMGQAFVSAVTGSSPVPGGHGNRPIGPDYYDNGVMNQAGIMALLPDTSGYGAPPQPAYDPLSSAYLTAPPEPGGHGGRAADWQEASVAMQEMTANAPALEGGIFGAADAIGLFPKHIADTNTQTDALKAAIADITSKTHQIKFELATTQETRDRLSNFIFDILRSSGVTLGGGARGR